MPTIRQYRPAYFDGFETKTVEFSTTEELINIAFVKISRSKEFSGFAVADEHLMATYKKGKEWWVVGTLSDPNMVELPKWERNVPGLLPEAHPLECPPNAEGNIRSRPHGS